MSEFELFLDWCARCPSKKNKYGIPFINVIADGPDSIVCDYAGYVAKYYCLRFPKRSVLSFDQIKFYSEVTNRSSTIDLNRESGYDPAVTLNVNPVCELYTHPRGFPVTMSKRVDGVRLDLFYTYLDEGADPIEARFWAEENFNLKQLSRRLNELNNVDGIELDPVNIKLVFRKDGRKDLIITDLCASVGKLRPRS